eukprot:5290542-Amphidinium_carterae.1
MPGRFGGGANAILRLDTNCMHGVVLAPCASLCMPYLPRPPDATPHESQNLLPYYCMSTTELGQPVQSCALWVCRLGGGSVNRYVHNPITSTFAYPKSRRGQVKEQVREQS